MLLENMLTRLFKNRSFETIRNRIFPFLCFANVLVKYEYINASKQNHMTLRMDMFSLQTSKAKKKKRKETLFINIKLKNL